MNEVADSDPMTPPVAAPAPAGASAAVSNDAGAMLAITGLIYVLLLLGFAIAVREDLALVFRVAPAIGAVIALRYVARAERRVMASVPPSHQWWIYAPVTVAAAVVTLTAMRSADLDALGFALGGVAVFAGVRAAHLVRRWLAARRCVLVGAPVIAALGLLGAWLAPSTTVRLIAGAVTIVVGVLGVEAWSERERGTVRSDRVRWGRAGGGVAIVAVVAVVAHVAGVDPRTSSWILAATLLITALLTTANDTGFLVVGITIALLWAGAPRSLERSVSTEPSRGSPYYVALGDSYSSGEGAEFYFAGTNVDDDDRIAQGVECRRAPTAWPMLLNPPQPVGVGETLGIPTSVLFAACSGAVMADIHPTDPAGRGDGDGRVEPEQLDEVREVVEHVGPPAFAFVGIGGNDAQFGKVVRVCLAPGDCTEFVDDIERHYLADLEQRLVSTYVAIRLAIGADDDEPGPPLIAVPYPIPAVEPDTDDDTCTGVLLSAHERIRINRFAASLNAIVERAASTAGALYLEPLATALDDANAQLCDPQRRAGLNFLDLNPKEGTLASVLSPTSWYHNSVHPNERGHRLFAATVLRWLSPNGDGACVLAGSCHLRDLPADPMPGGIAEPQDASTGSVLAELIANELAEIVLLVSMLTLGWWLVIVAAVPGRRTAGGVVTDDARPESLVERFPASTI